MGVRWIFSLMYSVVSRRLPTEYIANAPQTRCCTRTGGRGRCHTSVHYIFVTPKQQVLVWYFTPRR